MSKISRRNTRGQFTGEELISIKMNKVLKEIAYKHAVRLQTLVRDKLREELQHQIYASYVSTGDGGYEHTHLLPTSVYAVIEGDTVKAKLMDKYYKGVDSEGNMIDIPVEEIYNYLKFGTTNSPKSDVYPYVDENGKITFAEYTPTPPHNFEAETRKVMNTFLDDIIKNPENALKPYLQKYKNKRL